MEFLTEVATPLISAAGAIIVCLVNNFVQMRKRDIDQDKHIEAIKTELREQMMELNAAYQQSVAVITVKLDDLNKKQEKHNKVIERTYNLESYTKLLDERVKHLERSAK